MHCLVGECRVLHRNTDINKPYPIGEVSALLVLQMLISMGTGIVFVGAIIDELYDPFRTYIV